MSGAEHQSGLLETATGVYRQRVRTCGRLFQGNMFVYLCVVVKETDGQRDVLSGESVQEKDPLKR